MRHDVVHALGGHQPALALALRAERMLTTVGDARPVPANAVATLASIPSTLVGLLLPLALVLLASAALDKYAAADDGTLLETWHGYPGCPSRGISPSILAAQPVACPAADSRSSRGSRSFPLFVFRFSLS